MMPAFWAFSTDNTEFSFAGSSAPFHSARIVDSGPAHIVPSHCAVALFHSDSFLPFWAKSQALPCIGEVSEWSAFAEVSKFAFAGKAH